VRRTRIRRCGDESAKCSVQIGSIRPALSQYGHDAVHNIFNLQGIDAAYLPSRGGKRMAQCGRGSVTTHPGSDCFCSPRVNLTMPARDLVGGVFGIVVKGRAAARDAARGLISFKVLFNNPTDYALWVQYTTALIVITTYYDLKIRE
jgi:hypothetical protein